MQITVTNTPRSISEIIKDDYANGEDIIKEIVRRTTYDSGRVQIAIINNSWSEIFYDATYYSLVWGNPSTPIADWDKQWFVEDPGHLFLFSPAPADIQVSFH